MVTEFGLGILGTLVGAVAGSIVGGWFGLKQTKVQQEAENKRNQADAFLNEKAERLSKLYDCLIQIIALSSPCADSTVRDISKGLYINESELEDQPVPTSQELLKAQKHAMLFITEKEGINRVNKAVGLWLPILRMIESTTEDSIRIQWEDIPVQNSVRKDCDRPLSHEEVQKISDEAIDVLRDEIHGPIKEL